ncbi:hypothetical protein [Pseudolactococcus laudensis]|uniref:hypothetical protein n=1 Tax=Pseudolactococcus laudensis TaxID=1494461 RepID=UPI002FCB31EE
MNKSEKSNGLIYSFRDVPKGTLTGIKYKNRLFGTNDSNGFFAYIGGFNDF